MIGLFPSLKMGRMVAFKSLIEQDYLYVLDFEAAVTAFEEQPVSIEYLWEGDQHKYTPDFLVRRKSLANWSSASLHPWFPKKKIKENLPWREGGASRRTGRLPLSQIRI